MNEEVFQQVAKGSLEAFIQQINQPVTACTVTHHLGGQKALEAAKVQVGSFLAKGGVVHYQRTCGLLSQLDLLSVLALDLLWLQETFGEIKRMTLQKRGTISQQVFITLRLANRVIVQYGLNSLDGLKASFSFDFSSRGYNLAYDDEQQAPLVLNLQQLKTQMFTTDLTESAIEKLQVICADLSQSMKGGLRDENRDD